MRQAQRTGDKPARARRAKRGHPVFVVAIVLLAWIGARAAMWDPRNVDLPPVLRPSEAMVSAAPSVQTAGPTVSLLRDNVRLASASSRRLSGLAPGGKDQLTRASPLTNYGAGLQAGVATPPGWIAGYTIMFSAGRQGFGQLARLGRSVGEPLAARPVPAFALHRRHRFPHDAPGRGRFSVDAWGLWRDGTGSSVAAGAPAYGRSQTGAVLRYRLADSSPYQPEAHARVSAALDGARERDVALGVSARPLPGLPVRLAAEGRITQTPLDTQLRAGAYAVSEISPFDLPAGTRGEVYLQAGYVTGDFATPFIDGHARVTRELAEFGEFRLDAGGGAWGGAQQGAARLDIGPTASVHFPLGDGYARISADYRVRMAGDAEPDSGPALTLATGF